MATWNGMTNETTEILWIMTDFWIIILVLSCPAPGNKIYERWNLKQCWFAELLNLHLHILKDRDVPCWQPFGNVRVRLLILTSDTLNCLHCWNLALSWSSQSLCGLYSWVKSLILILKELQFRNCYFLRLN